MNDALGDRMKKQYEDRTRFSLPRRTYTILRLDGKAFHTFTAHLPRPYDQRLMKTIDDTAIWLCEEIMGAQLAYTQSDEISILLTDFSKPNTEAWFDGNVQKMVSVAASIATAAFNNSWILIDESLATFDARVFTVPDHVEVENYFIWRQKDAERNSIQMLAQHHYSHKELHRKDCGQLLDMILAKDDNWNSHPTRFKRGGLVTYGDQKWAAEECPIFTSEDGRARLKSLIPLHWENQP